MTGLSRLEQRSFGGLLFDMDGTILTSIAAAERVWTRWAGRHGVDVANLLPKMHGARAVDTMTNLGLPGIDIAREVAWLVQEEMIDLAGIEPIPGAVSFLSSLPSERWAIVTSAPRELARVRLAAAGIPEPAMMITAEDVTRGKPAPDCFLLGARRLGVAPRDCLIFEDAPAGIAAAEAAGAEIIVITATHSHPLETPHAMIRNYEGLTIESDSAGIRIA